MFALHISLQYYMYTQPTDMRKSFDALSGVVQSSMQRNPTSGEVFVFINKHRNLIKLLHWEPGGFVLYSKRLERGTFELPAGAANSTSQSIKWSDLVMIVEGISLKNIQHRKRFVK